MTNRRHGSSVRKVQEVFARKKYAELMTASQSLPRHFAYAPAGYHTLTPFIAVSDGAAAIDFYIAAFGAKELSRFSDANGTISHAELLVGDSIFQLGASVPASNVAAPDGRALHGSFSLYVKDVDATYAAALSAGAKATGAPEDVFSGDRLASVTCPAGYRWVILTHLEDVSAAEMERRVAELYG